MATITGSNANDTLVGNGDAVGDMFYGLNGNDRITGDRGFDTLNGGAGNDTLNGGEGDDYADYRDAGTVFVNLSTHVAAGTLSGTDSLISIELVFGAAGDDTLIGDAVGNYIRGFAGNDSISAGGGDDNLFTGGGNDTLNGGLGNDSLTGGTGRDDFVFGAAASNGTDRITDFVHGVDRLVFGAASYGFSAGHVLTAAQFTAGTTAVGTGAQFIWDAASHHLYWDADGTGAGARIDLALLDAATVTKEDLVFL